LLKVKLFTGEAEGRKESSLGNMDRKKKIERYCLSESRKESGFSDLRRVPGEPDKNKKKNEAGLLSQQGESGEKGRIYRRNL